MKVICIDNSPGIYGVSPRLLKVGKVYTARQAPLYPESYELDEVPIDPLDGRPVCFKKWRFIPISSIDETTFERNYNRQPA